jgi:hypothetical protein
MNANTEPNTVPKVINGRINGRFAPGYSGNPGGSPEATRRAFNKRFLLDLAEDWQQHGREVFKRVRRESPAAYLKVCAMLVPREMKIEHKSGIKEMSDEQLEAAIEMLTAIVDQNLGEKAKVIEGGAEPVSEPGPRRKAKRLTLTEPDDDGDGDNAGPISGLAEPSTSASDMQGSERTGPPHHTHG